MESDVPPFTMKVIKTKISTSKGKARETQDKDFEEEKAWLLFKNVPAIQKLPIANGSLQDRAPKGSETSLAEPNVLSGESGLECGCCFSPAPFVCIPHPNHSEPIS